MKELHPAEAQLTFEDEQAKQAEDNLRYFWEQDGLPEAERISAHDKKIMFDVPLTIYLDELQTSPSFDDERNKLVEEFRSKGWLPKSSEEASMAALKGVLKGPEESLRRASRIRTGQPERALESTHATIDGYRKDAHKDISILNKAIIDTGTQNRPDVNIIHSNTEILYVMADYLHGREMLDRAQMDARRTKAFKDRQKYWRGFMVAAAQPGHAGDEAIVDIFEDLLKKAKQRSHFWTKKAEMADKKVGHLLVKDAQEHVIEVHEPTLEEKVTPNEAGPTNFESMLPKDVDEHLKARRLEYGNRFEGLDSKGMPQAAKMAVLENEFPEITPAERSDYQDSKAILAARAKRPPAKTPRRRPSYSPRDKGAPPHIVKEIRGDIL